MEENFTPDAIDLKLLTLLQDDASQSNQALAERACVSPPTCLRRVRRLRETGWIEGVTAIVNIDRLATHLGHGLTVVAEVTLERQNAEALDHFEQLVVTQPAVQQCYRVTPGPDFVLIVQVPDMPAWNHLAGTVLRADQNVRNVKAYFSVRRAKFTPKVPIPIEKR
jgi:DNA-binding Lrp family transcriptional regulator